jgi:hypothetical protein
MKSSCSICLSGKASSTVEVGQLVEFVVTAAGKAIHFDGLGQQHLIVEAQRFDRHTAEFGKVSDPDHGKVSIVFLYPPA